MKRTLPYYPAFLILLLALLTGGCAAKPKPYESKDRYSFAQNVLYAAGAETNLDRRNPLPSTEGAIAEATVSALAHAGSNAGNLISSALGRGGWMFAGSLFIQPNLVESAPAIIGWMPKEMAGTKEEAGQKYTEIMATAMERAITEVEMPAGYRILGESAERRFRDRMIDGPGCGEGGVICRYRYLVSGTASESPAPQFLGGGDAWVWDITEMNSPRGAVGYSSFYRPGHRTKKIEGKEWPKFPDFDLYQRISAHLPEWMFIYLCPGQSVGIQTSLNVDGEYKFIKVPLILSQGKIQSFETPPH